MQPSEPEVDVALNNAPRIGLAGKLPKLYGGYGDVRTSELRVVGDVQKIERRFQGQPLIQPETAENLGVPVADGVVPQTVDVLRENARIVGVGLIRRAAFEPYEAGGGAVFPVQTAAGEYHMLMFCEWVDRKSTRLNSSHLV